MKTNLLTPKIRGRESSKGETIGTENQHLGKPEAGGYYEGLKGNLGVVGYFHNSTMVVILYVVKARTAYPCE